MTTRVHVKGSVDLGLKMVQEFPQNRLLISRGDDRFQLVPSTPDTDRHLDRFRNDTPVRPVDTGGPTRSIEHSDVYLYDLLLPRCDMVTLDTSPSARSTCPGPTVGVSQTPGRGPLHSYPFGTSEPRTGGTRPVRRTCPGGRSVRSRVGYEGFRTKDESWSRVTTHFGGSTLPTFGHFPTKTGPDWRRM